MPTARFGNENIELRDSSQTCTLPLDRYLYRLICTLLLQLLNCGDAGWPCGKALRRMASGQRGWVRFHVWLSFLSTIVVCGHCPVIVPLTMNETLKWLSSLPIIIYICCTLCNTRNAHYGDGTVALGTDLYLHPHPHHPSLDLGPRQYLSGTTRC